MSARAVREAAPPPVTLRQLGRRDYEPLWREMREFTEARGPATADEIWFTEHPPVFTLGLNADREHLLSPGDIPVIQVDRGGQVTYHGPGQLLVYPLLDLKRTGLGIRDLVTGLEQSVIELLAEADIEAHGRRDAPGVYVEERKVASIGLRVRRGASYHGMALNVDLDLEPFSRINPCGMRGLAVVDLKRLGLELDLAGAAAKLSHHLLSTLHLRAAA